MIERISCCAVESDLASKTLRQADPSVQNPCRFSVLLGNTTPELEPNIPVSYQCRVNFPPAHKCSREESQTASFDLLRGPNQAPSCRIIDTFTASQPEMSLVMSTNAQQLLPQLQLTGDMPPSSMSASSQQLDVFSFNEQGMRTISARATNTTCTVKLPHTAEVCASWPQPRQPNPPHAGRLPNPSQENWKLVPVVQSSKAGRLKRKQFNKDMAGVESAVGFQQASQQRARHIKTSPFIDLQTTSSNLKLHSPEAVTQLTAKNTVNAQAFEGKLRSSGSDSARLLAPSQMPPQSDAPSAGDLQPEKPVTKPGSVAQQEDALTILPCNLSLTEQICCKAQQIQPAQQVEPEQQAQQPQQHEQAQKAQQTQQPQATRHKLKARADWLRTLADQLEAEAQKAEPGTVEEVQKHVQHQDIQRNIQKLSFQKCQALADKAERSIRVPVQLPNAQAAMAVQRSQGMALRDSALPLQDGQIMCPEAQPVMATLQEVHEAAACQQTVTAGAVCFWPPLCSLCLICHCNRDSLAQHHAFQSVHTSMSASDKTWTLIGKIVIPIGKVQSIFVCNAEA